MLFNDILGLKHIKSHLVKSVENNRIPHAQLFVGPEGSGTLPMALAYAQYILCKNTDGENNTGNESCNLKFNNFSHPDMHFAFPVTTTAKVKSHPVSSLFLNEWRQLLNEQPYGNLMDWYRVLDVDNKQGQIGVDEAKDILSTLSLKSYEGGYKVLLIWMAEKINTAASNKLLKLIEEPPNKTVFILITEDEEQIINTIKSRCQVLHFPPLAQEDIKSGLIKQYGLSDNDANRIAHQAEGNYNKACDIATKNSDDALYEQWFIDWVRTAFKARGNKAVVNSLMDWAQNIASNGKESQKLFLNFCIDFFRQALLKNYGADELVYYETKTAGFDIAKFAPFVHNNNIMDITDALQEAIYHIERNGNPKVVLTDLSLKLTRFLHAKKD